MFTYLSPLTEGSPVNPFFVNLNVKRKAYHDNHKLKADPVNKFDKRKAYPVNQFDKHMASPAYPVNQYDT